jgi:hypothetical protein
MASMVVGTRAAKAEKPDLFPYVFVIEGGRRADDHAAAGATIIQSTTFLSSRSTTIQRASAVFMHRMSVLAERRVQNVREGHFSLKSYVYQVLISWCWRGPNTTDRPTSGL